MTERLLSIKQRCETRQLQVKPITYNLEDIDQPEIKSPVEALIVMIPEERGFKNLILLDDDELANVETSQFEKYRFVKGYEAVWSEELRSLECEIQSDDPLRITSLIFRRLDKVLGGENKSTPKSQFELPPPHPNLKITIGEASLEFTILVLVLKNKVVLC